MSGGTENASVERAGMSFPPSWGYPQGRPGSEERAAWVRENVIRHAVESVAPGDSPAVVRALRESLRERRECP